MITLPDHRAVLGALPKPLMAQLSMKSDAAGARHLLLYLAALASTSAYIALEAPFWGLALLPHGTLLVFLFTLSHECTHQTAFRTKWVNDALGHAIAPILCLPFLWFRYFHFAHHKYTNDPLRDPEIANHPRPQDWGSYLVYLSGWGYWSGMASTLWRNARGQFDASYLPARQHAAMRREARIILLVYLCLALSLIVSPLALWLWLVPVLIAQPLLRLYLLAEHGLCPPVANMLENTRTTSTNRLVRFLAWNMPYHIEHHAAPQVPFHRLPDLHREIRTHLVSSSPSYRAFSKDYLRSLGVAGKSAQG